MHRLQVEFYRALVMRAEALAREGRVVEAPRHARVPMGEDPALYLTPESPQEARERVREMLREMGLQPERYERLAPAGPDLEELARLGGGVAIQLDDAEEVLTRLLVLGLGPSQEEPLRAFVQAYREVTAPGR